MSAPDQRSRELGLSQPDLAKSGRHLPAVRKYETGATVSAGGSTKSRNPAVTIVFYEGRPVPAQVGGAAEELVQGGPGGQEMSCRSFDRIQDEEGGIELVKNRRRKP
jgi:hypothetical protein